MDENNIITPKHSKIRIVFIEDYQLVRVGIASYLDGTEGIEIVAQSDTAEQGMRYIEQYHPDLVLMDLGLPGMNGIEATRIIKDKFPKINVIILTSHELEESVIAALGAGANAYCLKDIPSKRLVEVIHSVMDGAAWLDPAIAQVALSVFVDNKVPHVAATAEAEHVPLGERERDVLRLLTLGKNNNEIAEELHVSVHTIKSHVSAILQKLSVHDRVQAAVKAVTAGLVTLDS